MPTARKPARKPFFIFFIFGDLGWGGGVGGCTAIITFNVNCGYCTDMILRCLPPISSL